MRIILPLIFLSFFIGSCQKEVSIQNNNNIVTTVSFDSLVGTWKYLYDYRLTTTVANPDIIIDSMFGNNDFTPFSYLKINTDTSFSFFETAMQSLPAYGYGYAGQLKLQDSIRAVYLSIEKETQDDFVHTTIPNPGIHGTMYRIKYLSHDSMVLYLLLTPTPPGNIHYLWCDVFKR